MRADLHVHTTASDGLKTPSQVIREAQDASLDVIAITDHDTVKGVQEALAAAAGSGLYVIPGVELNIQFSSELHMLGYFIDPGSDVLNRKLEELAFRRRTRVNMIVQKLQALGLEIRKEDVEAHSAGQSIGRSHVGHTMVDMGYAKDMNDAFTRYLAKGRPAYVPNEPVTIREGIDLIHRAGGAAVWAHPVETFSDPVALRQLYEMMRGYGLDGLEIVHPSATAAQTSVFRRWCREDGLIATGGSDWHAREGNRPLGWPAAYYDIREWSADAEEKIRRNEPLWTGRNRNQ